MDFITATFCLFAIAYFALVAIDFGYGLVHLYFSTPVPATLAWVQLVEETELEPVCAIAMAKTRSISTAKRYKLRGQDVVHLKHLAFDLPAAVKRYKLRSQDVVKLIHLEELFA